MPFWCIQDNECLACRGGCEDYETKREAMRERRASFWRIMDEMEETKETNMGHCPQETKQQQGAANTDTVIYREPSSFYDDGWDTIAFTHDRRISITVAGHGIIKTLKQWHTLAREDIKRREESQINIGGKWGEPQNSGGILGMDFNKIEERVIGSLAPDAPVKAPTFAQKLAALLNENSKEKGSNTPDFVLAEYLTNCLGNFEAAIKAREKFYGVSSRPGSGTGYEGCTITKIDDEHTHAIELNDRQVRTGEMWSVAPGCQQFGN